MLIKLTFKSRLKNKYVVINDYILNIEKIAFL